MVIACDNCGMRFYLAEARLGPGGGKVRCSNCHHRFHVSPPKRSDTPQERAIEDSARELAAEGEDESGSGGLPSMADWDLDNPEFLFDGRAGGETIPGEMTVPEGSAPESQSFSNEVTAIAEPDDEPPSRSTLSPCLGADPEVSQRQEELGLGETSPPPEPEPQPEEAPVQAAPVAPEFGTGRATEIDLQPAPEEPLDTATPVSQAPLREPEPEPEPESQGAVAEEDPVTGSSSDELEDLPDADEDEDTLSGWDPLADPVLAGQRPQTRAGPGEGAKPRDPGPREPRSASRERSRFEPEETSAIPGLGDAVGPLAAEDAVSAGGWLERAAALIVGLALLSGGLRVALNPEVDVGPARVEGAGWSAESIQSFRASDASGRSVLVVLGDLEARGSTPPPQVSATLLDRGGKTLGRPVQAELVRLDEAALDPEPLSMRLAARTAPRVPMRVRGFTVLIPDPEPAASHYRLELSPAPAAPRKRRPDPRGLGHSAAAPTLPAELPADEGAAEPSSPPPPAAIPDE